MSVPTTLTDASVFDALHRLFGAPAFTGEESEWIKWRMREIAKIKAYRIKRKIDPFELVEAAHFCRRRGIWIKAHWELYQYLPEVNRERLGRAKADRSADLEVAIQAAIAIEAEIPDSPWLDRLIRAAGPSRQEVYEAWAEWAEHR